MIFKREPAAFMAALHALIALAIGFGLDLSVEQFSLIMVAVAAVLGFIVRAQVSPNVDK
jgi:hypothetical protein